MKIFWCTRFVKGKRNFQGEELRVEKVSSRLLRRIDTVYDEENEYMNKYVRHPHRIKVLQTIILIVASITTFFTFCFLNVDSQGVALWWPLILLCVVSWLIYTGIYFDEYKKEQNYKKSEKSASYKQKLDMLYEELDKELGVPSDALNVDIVSFKYRMVGKK